MRLLIALAERAPTTFRQTALPSLPDLVQTILQQQQQQQQQQHPELLIELVVMGAQSMVMTTSVEPNHEQQQQDMLLLTKLSTACLIPLLQQQHATTTTVLEHLVQAAEHAPALLYPAIQPLAIFVCHAAAAQQSQTTTTAVQVLTSLVLRRSSEESSRNCYCPPPPHNVITVARQAFDQELIPAVLQQLRLAVEQQDVEEWAAEAPALQQVDATEADDEDITYAQILLQDMLHTTCGVGSTTTTTPASCLQTTVLPAVEQWMNVNKSSYTPNAAKAAAMLVLQCVVEALPVSFAPYRSVATEAALACCACAAEDYQDVRVQHHALVLLALLSEVNENDDTNSNASSSGRILEALVRCSHSPCPRVAATACLAMVSYCRCCFSDDSNQDASHFFLPYVSDILAALTSGPLRQIAENSGMVVVQIRAMGALAAVAQVCGPTFAPYYGSVMPSLVACCTQQTGAAAAAACSLHQIGAAVEAATVIMQALGDEQKHLLAADAEFLMQSMIPLLQKDVELDSYLLSAFARIASVLGEAYAPYVETVLPHLLQRATERTDVEISVSFKHFVLMILMLVICC